MLRPPPMPHHAGAFGMNTGVCDAHNLAWKLAAVLQGRAGPGLLDTYTGAAGLQVRGCACLRATVRLGCDWVAF